MNETDTIDLVNRAVEVAIHRAQRSIVQPQFLFGTVVAFNMSGPSIHEVLLDGDDDPISAMDISGAPFSVGDRVAVVFVPPHQALVIGVVSPQRGPLARVLRTSNTPNWAADSTTDMFLSEVSVVAGRTYALHLHASALHASFDINARFVLNARVDLTTVGRFDDFRTTGGEFRRVVDSTVHWTATTEPTVDIDVFVNEVVNGSTLQLEGSSTVPRHLTIYDLGVVP